MTSAFHTNTKCCLPLKSYSTPSAPSHTKLVPGLKLQIFFTYTLVFYLSPCYYQSHSLQVKSSPRSLELLWLLMSIYWPLKENFQMKTQYGGLQGRLPSHIQTVVCFEDVWKKFPSNSDSRIAKGQYHSCPWWFAKGHRDILSFCILQPFLQTCQVLSAATF